jgi:hypothetical protein
MINPEVPSFYVVQATGEVAELIASVFSPTTMSDVVEVVIVSREFSNDIEPINEMSAGIEVLTPAILSEIKKTTEFNPLYVPSTPDQIDESIDADVLNDMTKFTAMGGNPYAIAQTKIRTESETLLTATVRYNEYEIPSYDTVVKSCSTSLLN